MRRIRLVFLILFLSSCLYSQNKYVKGVIECQEKKTPIAFATILEVSKASNGTTSNSEGSFKLKISEDNTRLYISSIGFFDTTIVVSRFGADISIQLRPKQYELEEVFILGQQLSNYQIGSRNNKIRKKNAANIGFPFKSSGFSHGVFIKNSKKTQQSILKTIDFFVADIGPIGGEFLVRFMLPIDKLKPNKFETTDSFTDIHTFPIIIKAQKRGWNTVDCSDLNITFPNEDFVMLITPINTGESMKWSNHDGNWYGSVFAVYDNKRMHQIKWIVKEYDKLCYVDVKGVDNYVPAFVFTVLK